MPAQSPMSFLCDELQALKKNWALFLGLGIALSVLGLLALLMPFVAGVYTAVFIGISLLLGGFVQVFAAFSTRGWGGFLLQLLMGVIYIITGMLMIEQPVEVLLVLTILVAVSLLVGGIFRILISLMNQFPGWGWILVGGIIDVILGLMIWRQFPMSALWVVGLFVGIGMIYSGVTWTMMALSLREVPLPPPAPPQAGPAIGSSNP